MSDGAPQMSKKESLSTVAAGSGMAAVKRMASSKNMVYGFVPPDELAKPYDIAIIGGGPAGVAAASKAAFLGRRALVIDDAPCAPNELDLTFGAPTGLFSKALRDTAKSLDVGLLETMGLDKRVVWAQVQASVGKLARNNVQTVHALLSEFKIAYLRARATIVSADGEGEGGSVTLSATAKDGTVSTITASRVLVTSGSTPTRSKDIPFDEQRVFDSDSIAKLAFLPKRVVISGAGIIGIEYAKIFAKLKADVTVLIRGDAKSSLARLFDPDIVQGLIDDLAESGVTVLAHTTVEGFGLDQSEPFDKDDPAPFTIHLKGKEGSDTPSSIEADVFLAAMGRRPTSAGLGLDVVGGIIDEKSGAVKVDESFRVEGVAGGLIYAAGDVIGPPALASTGVEQAKTAVGVAFGESSDDKAHVGRDNFPVGVWTIPEIGYYGYTKAAAIEKGKFDAEEGVAPYTACLRGRVFAPQGFVKLVFNRADGRILGVHIMGADACELIHFGMELVNAQRTIFDVMSMLFTAVTFHELFKFAALDANSKLQFGMQWQTILKALGEVVSKDDMDGLRAKFDELDTDKSGELDAEELFAVFKGLGKDVTVGTLSNMLRLADKDGSGTIGFEEFQKIIQAL